LGRIENVELGLASRDHRAQLREHHAADVRQIALPLKHAAELGQIRLEPVLLGVLLRRIAQVADHFVDRVL
jgi:hypothetical protein